MDRWQGRVALVTGASSGVGEETVRHLVKHGMKVVACARSFHKLQALANELAPEKGELLPIQCDLRKEDDIKSMFSQVKEKWGGVDVCVNSAGLALDAPIIEGDTEAWREMWDVNVTALCVCSKETVQSLRERNVDDGYIININSLAGHRTGRAHYYSATKFAVTCLTDGIRYELRALNSHIRISSISPALIETNFAVPLMGNEKAKELYETQPSLKSRDLADAVVYLLSTPGHVQIHDMLMRNTETLH